MKIKRVLPNNRKRCFVVDTAAGAFEFPFSLLSVKPSASNPIVSVEPDREIGSEGFTYRLKSGAQDTVLLDQIRYSARDPEALREELLFDLSCKADEILKGSGFTKRALARRMRVAPAQLYRLLDPKFQGKSIDQMVKLLCTLGYRVSFSARKAA